MIDNIIRRYKDMRSRAFLRNVYDGQYAFVGIGGHSLTNLYPVLQYLQVPLKYICCRSEENTALIEAKYKDIKATTSLSEIHDIRYSLVQLKDTYRVLGMLEPLSR